MTFDEIIAALQQIHVKMPDLSFGEIIQVATDRAKKRTNVCVADLPDKQLLTALQAYAGQEETARKEDLVRSERQKRLQTKDEHDVVNREREKPENIKRLFKNG